MKESKELFSGCFQARLAASSRAAAGNPWSVGIGDLQHNGITARYREERACVTVDFSNPELTREDVIRAAHATYATGVPFFVPTIVTSEVDVAERNARVIVSVMKEPAGRGILGIHFEGPCLDVACKGAHKKEIIEKNPPSIALVERLYEACRPAEGGSSAMLIFTMSPNYSSSAETIRWLTGRRVVVSLGHFEMKDRDLLRLALDAGASGLTHVSNAWSKNPDHYGPKNFGVARLLSNPSMKPMIITDGIHTPSATIEDLFYTMAQLRDGAYGQSRHPTIVSDLSPLAGAKLGTKDGKIFHGLEEVPEVLMKDGMLYTAPLTGSCHSLAQQALTLAAAGLDISPETIVRAVSQGPFDTIIASNLAAREWTPDAEFVKRCLELEATSWIEDLNDPERAKARVLREHAAWAKDGLVIPDEWVW